MGTATRLMALSCSLLSFSVLAQAAAKPADPATGEAGAPAASDGGVGNVTAATATGSGAAPVAGPAPAPKKIDPKLFDDALNDYFAGRPREAAPKLFEYTEGVPSKIGRAHV